MGFIDVLKDRARASVKTIVLPETEDMRTLDATEKILKEGIAKVILVGNEETVKKSAAEGGYDIFMNEDILAYVLLEKLKNKEKE